jgi:hypothetical protein
MGLMSTECEVCGGSLGPAFCPSCREAHNARVLEGVEELQNKNAELVAELERVKKELEDEKACHAATCQDRDTQTQRMLRLRNKNIAMTSVVQAATAMQAALDAVDHSNPSPESDDLGVNVVKELDRVMRDYKKFLEREKTIV